AALMTLFVVLRPVTTVADAVARELARTTAPAATGSSTVWAWLAAAAAVLLAVGAVLAAASSRSWAGLSGRYDRGAKPASGPRGEVRTTWDELSEGHDPTLRDAPDET
ncbi:MAG: Trp biosynthesis protein, partial [Dermatophilaceae bacterium]|nr:Trp biosynthesis protein [Dermatophilaceae bacterium]